MPDSKFKMIAGLGNPGTNYSRTRHNIGFLVADNIIDRCASFPIKTRFDTEYTKIKIKGQDVFIVKPLSYMNRSGFPIQKFSSYYKIDTKDIIVIHDEIDLEFGTLKIVQNRGHGGHNGVRSIVSALGKRDFVRVRVGVGRPGLSNDVSNHVLGKFSEQEKKSLDALVKNGADACLSILNKDITFAMNTWNSK
ncbi:MAG: aminoacyl-tRNA hydrolase [Desulfobacteraceae bacterium]|nr:aminoacyl-tRNA hydrolase [Desulfobacteraceae bacterium]